MAEQYAFALPVTTRAGYGEHQPKLFGPRGAFTRPAYGGPNLARARRLVGKERYHRVPAIGGRFQSHRQISQAGKNWPVGYASGHGGRGVAEVERDEYLNTLRAARGAGPIAPAGKPSFTQRMQTWGSGVTQRAEERSFWDTRRATPGGYR